MNTFDFVGTIRKNKEKPVLESKPSRNGNTINHTLGFPMLCNGNSQYLRIQDWTYANEKTPRKIYTYSKSEAGSKGSQIIVDWNERLNPDVISKVAGFRKYYINLGNESAAFITAYDFMESMNEVINNPAFDGRIFRVSGNIEYTYSANTGRWFCEYVPNRVELISENVVPPVQESCTGSIVVYYTNDNYDDEGDPRKAIVDPANVGENAKMYCYARYYDGNTKSNCFAPIQLDIPTSNPAKYEAIKKYLALDKSSDVKSIGFMVDFIRGSMKQDAIDMTTISDEDRQNIELGLTDLETIRAERRKAFGPKIEATVVNKFTAGYTKGAKEETTITPDDLRKIPAVSFKGSEESGIIAGATETATPDDNFDLFDLN